MQANCVPVEFDPFDRKLPVDQTQNDVVRFGVHAAVDHEDVAVLDVGVPHRVSFDSTVKSGGLVPDHELVQVKAFLNVIIGWAWKPTGNALACQGEQELLCILGCKKFNCVGELHTVPLFQK